jgi:hypothetical protein
MSVDIVEASSALGRAFAGGAGAADILRERGILELVKSFAELEHGTEDLTKLTLPEFRQALFGTILDPMGKVAGATEKLAGTFSGQVSMMSDAIFNLKSALGDALLPVVQDVIENGITPFLNELQLWVVTNKELIQQKFQSVVLDIVAGMKDLAAVMPSIVNVMTTLSGLFKLAAGGGGTFLSVLQGLYGAITQNQEVVDGAWIKFGKGSETAREGLDLLQKGLGIASDETKTLSDHYGELKKNYEEFLKRLKLTAKEKTQIEKFVEIAENAGKTRLQLLEEEFQGLNDLLIATEATEEEKFRLKEAFQMRANALIDKAEEKEVGSQEQILERLRDARHQNLSEIEEATESELELLLDRHEQILEQMIEFGAAASDLREGDLEKELAIENRASRIKMGIWKATAQFFGQMQALMVTLADENNKALLFLAKAAAIAEATISTYLAATNALADFPFPYNMIVASIVSAAGFANVANIAATALAEGGVVTKPTLALIGEAGPEAVIPLSRTSGVGPTAGGTGGVVIQNVEMFPNVTEGDVLFGIPDTTLERWVRNKLYVVMNSLNERRIMPEFAR